MTRRKVDPTQRTAVKLSSSIPRETSARLAAYCAMRGITKAAAVAEFIENGLRGKVRVSHLAGSETEGQGIDAAPIAD